MNDQKILFYPGGSKYEGQAKDGKAHGKGSLTFSDEMKFVGDFKNGKPNGYGILTTPEGLRYEGNWKDGALTGHMGFWGKLRW